MTKEDYAKRAYQWAQALKALDPSISLILCGETGYSTWDSHVLNECIQSDRHALRTGNPKSFETQNVIDMHSIHIYTYSADPVKNAHAPLSAERAIQICASLIDMARIKNGVPPTTPRQTICFDEWNVWDPEQAPGEAGAEQMFNLSDALGVAVWFNVFVRQSKYVGMANLAQNVNVIAPLTTLKNGLYKQATWWPLLLFSKYMRGWSVATHVTCAAYEGETEPAWLRSAMDIPVLDISATVNEEGWVSMVVVNTDLKEEQDVELPGVVLREGQRVTVYEVSGEKWDATNTPDKEEVTLKERTWDGRGSFTFLPFSITMLRWKSP